jgi:SAM-dependent methyltransferase
VITPFAVKHAYPENFARFYDTIYHNLRDSVDNDYFQNEIKNTGGKILEIGVGTGRLFTNALDLGADIYGLDISQSMLDVLYKKVPAEQHYRLRLQNMVNFSLDFKFDLIIAPFRVIMHLLEKEDQIKAINNVYDHLNPGGRFIFDTFIPDLNQLIKGLDNKMDFEGEYAPGKNIRRFASTSPDLIKQIIQVNFHMEWEENNELHHDDWILPLRFFFRYELEHLIERSKFRQYKIYGDYQKNELSRKSKDFVVVCKK